MVKSARKPEINANQLLNSLRSSEFNLSSAICALIDNSIQAKAKNISVKIEDVPLGGKRKYSVINKILCGDDGYGMDGSPNGVLHSCMILGYSNRFNDRSGVGRFGIGMTLAGIRFATKIEVFSKQSGQPWHYIIFDLNNMKDTEIGIAPPMIMEPPKRYQNMTGKDHGTLVIWSGFDNFSEQDLHTTSYSDKFEAPASLDPYGYLNHFFGRTYRKFIWEGVKINLNGKDVYSFDPLYLNKKFNQFQDDDSAKIVFETAIEWQISPNVKSESKTSNINIIITLLPEQYRKNRGRAGMDFKGRYIDENEGISILRGNREVFYDHIPFFQETRNKKILWEDKDRWWGCEINYSPELDESFSINYLKRGITPTKELKSALYSIIKPVRDACIEQVKQYWHRQESR